MSPSLSPLPRYSGANYPTKEQILHSAPGRSCKSNIMICIR